MAALSRLATARRTDFCHLGGRLRRYHQGAATASDLRRARWAIGGFGDRFLQMAPAPQIKTVLPAWPGAAGDGAACRASPSTP